MATATPILFPTDAPTQSYPPLSSEQQKTAWITLGVLIAVVMLVFLDSLWRTAAMWREPRYQFGVVIPIISIVLIYMHRQPFLSVPAWHRWIGVGLLLVGMLIRVWSSQRTIYYTDNLSIIPCLLGVFVMVGGLPTLKWVGPALLFLFFMFPFPHVIEKMLMAPLQAVATKLSTAALVTLGVDAVRENNNIYLPNRDNAMNVAEQCSGLRMSTILTGMAVAFALFAKSRPWWERTIIVLSAIPIAVIVNVTRITLTGLLYTFCSYMKWGDDLVDKVSHDFAGLVMIVMAYGLLLLEFQILKHLVIDVPEEVSPAHVLR